MISYNVPINAQRMTIGVQGENNVREFLFDVTEWRQLTGDIGTAEMVVQRYKDTSPYAVSITMHDENTVSWIPTSTDTAKAGAGKIQLMWIANRQTIKTKIFDMKVDPSLDYQLPDDSLDPWASWVPDVINAAVAMGDLPGTVADAAADWLKENIKPTTPAVDASLSVSGAAADAKAAGDAIRSNEAILNKNLGKDAAVLGINQKSENRLNSFYMRVYPNDIIRFISGENVQQGLVNKFDTNYTFTGSLGWYSGDKSIIVDFDGYIVFEFRKEDNSNISVSEYDGQALVISGNTIKDISDLSYENIIATAKNLGYEFPSWKLTQRANNRISFVRTKINVGDIILFKAGSNAEQILLEKYNDAGEYTDQIYWTPNKLFYKSDYNGSVACVFRKSGGANIDVSDYDAKTYIIYANSTIKENINVIDSASSIINITHDDIVVGAYERNGSITSVTNRLRLKNFISVSVGDKIVFKAGNYMAGILVGMVNDRLNTFETSWVYGDTEYTCEHSGKMMLMFRRQDNSTVSERQFDCLVKVVRFTQFDVGSRRYNGEMFRCNYCPGIGYHRDSDSSFTKSYSDLIKGYDSIRSRLARLYGDVATNVPTPLTVTKESVITTNSGYEIYAYTFTPAFPKKRIMIQAGIHGNEYEGVFALYHLIRHIYTDGYVYPKLQDLADNCEIVVIPLVNPYGFEHNTKMNGDGINIHETYANETGVPKEMTAIRTVANNGHYDYAMDIHTDPYTPAKGCYGYAYVDGDLFEPLYKQIIVFRNILYNEFNFESHYYNSDDKDIIVGRIGGVTSGGGSIGYFARLGIPANLIEIATGAASSSEPFTETGSDEMMRIAVDWYGNVLLKAYEHITAQQ